MKGLKVLWPNTLTIKLKDKPHSPGTRWIRTGNSERFVQYSFKTMTSLPQSEFMLSYVCYEHRAKYGRVYSSRLLL